MRIHHYIYTCLAATLLAIAVWFCVPKEYAATTSISDEYKEMDLSIGMNNFTARIKKALNQDNTGINDIQTYCKVLKTEDFARQLSKKKIKGEETFGKHVIENRSWWQSKKDTVEIISERINYNLSQKKAMLTIELKDSDPNVAALMLDSLMAELQSFINNAQQTQAANRLADVRRQLELAENEYHAAQKMYASYADSHDNANLQEEKTKEAELKDILQTKYDIYKDMSERCIREDALQKRSHYSFTTVKPNVVPREYSNHLIGYIIVFLTIALFATSILHLYRKHWREGMKFSFGTLSAPWTITLMIWGLIIILSQFRDPSLLNPAGEQFYISLILWLTFFVSTSLIIYNVLPHNGDDNPKATTSIDMTTINLLVFNSLFIVSAVLTPLYMKKIYDVVLMFGTEDFMKSVRDYAVYGDPQLGVLAYSNIINTALLIVAVWTYPHIKKWQLAWACFGCLLNALAIMEKGGLLLVFFCIVFVLFEKKIIKMRTIVVLSVSVLLLFYVFNLLRAAEDSDYQKNETIFGFIAMYVLSPPVAYCELNTEISSQFGTNTLPLIYYYLNKFGVGDFVIAERLQEFVFVPVATNVYTIFQPYFQDFGQTGVAYFGAFYGIICGLLYRYKQNGNSFAKCAYLYFAYILILQFFQENLFTVSLFVPRVLLLTYLCTQKTFRLTLNAKSDKKQ